MRTANLMGALLALSSLTISCVATGAEPGDGRGFFVDVHELGAGNVTVEAVAEAHQKDLEVQDGFGTHFLKYWVDETRGRVYCLSEAPDEAAVTETHRAAHGLLPASVHRVSEGEAARVRSGERYFLDVHRLGPGNVTAAAVAEAHRADLATQGRYDVNFVNYWVDEAEGMVWCLAEAPDAEAVSRTHAEAHGLVPDEIMEVVEGE